MTRVRYIALLLIAASVLALVGSIRAMAHRITDYYSSSDHKLYMFEPINAREFSFAGREVTIRDEDSPSGTVVTVRYGDESLRLDATIPPGPPQLPHLVRHAQWLQVLRFAEHGRGSAVEAADRVLRGEVPDRLVVVIRNPPRGADPDSWGQVWRKQWKFDLYEFDPQSGGFRHERLGYPTNRRNEPAKPGELVEGSWQFYAALFTMPKGSKPTPKFTGDALRAMDWTFPAATASILLLIGSLAALAAPARRRE